MAAKRTKRTEIMAKRKPAEPESAAEPTAAVNAEYTVLARRYRPQQFAELIGQEAVAQSLVNALESGRVAHAYLFTGARGVGKTSAARILAKALNCEKGPTATPCDQCQNCKTIAVGEDNDVLEIDGASNRGIDEIREIRQNVQYRPTRSRNKIYIIDEVHMLTTPAFNALLKTLEEPPPHVKFIFATTEVQSIPVTILSRCQRFDFGGISIPRILDRLKSIVASEKMQADDEALELVARRAGGSMRDAQSLLDQLLSFSGQKLSVDSVHQLLGTAHEERVTALADAVLHKDTKKALQILNDVMNQGQQLGELLDQLIDYWRDLMVVNCAGIEGQSVSVTSARRETLVQHAKAASLDTIIAGMDLLVTAKTRLRFSSHGRTLLEMALVRLGQLDDLLSVGQIAQWLSKEGTAPAPASRPAPPAPRQPVVPGSESAGEKKKLNADEAAPVSTIRLPFSQENLPAIWQQLQSESGFAINSDLRKVISTAISGPNALVMRVSRRYNTTSISFLEPARLSKIEGILTGIVGHPCSARIEWIDDAPAETSGPSSTAVAMGQQRQLRSELLQLPFVKQVSQVLGAQIVRADEGFGDAQKDPLPERELETDGSPEEE